MKAIGTQTLITEDLILRRFELSDAPAMFNNWAGRPDNGHLPDLAGSRRLKPSLKPPCATGSA